MKGSKSVIWLEVFVLVCTGCEILRFFNYDTVISHKYTHTHTLTHNQGHLPTSPQRGFPHRLLPLATSSTKTYHGDGLWLSRTLCGDICF